MKRTERHHLKENELQTLALQARELFDERRREANIVGACVAIIIVFGGGYFLWREHVQAQASALLAQAMAVQEARVSTPGTAAIPGTPGTYPTERARLEAAIA